MTSRTANFWSATAALCACPAGLRTEPKLWTHGACLGLEQRCNRKMMFLYLHILSVFFKVQKAVTEPEVKNPRYLIVSVKYEVLYSIAFLLRIKIIFFAKTTKWQLLLPGGLKYESLVLDGIIKMWSPAGSWRRRTQASMWPRWGKTFITVLFLFGHHIMIPTSLSLGNRMRPTRRAQGVGAIFFADSEERNPHNAAPVKKCIRFFLLLANRYFISPR